MPKEINILLLGETGAGKSTTLNALANYLKFSTFEEAVRSSANFTEVVPSQFTLPDPKTSGKVWVIKSKVDDINERHGSGESVTQAPTGYKFVFGDNVLRIIDTPGIGDTGGSGADKKNFEQILLLLQQHKNLHGLIIILKGNDNRKTIFFKYCITELLTHLHKSVIQNIVFCFTNSQVAPGSFGPGEGYKVMKSFLEDDISSVGIELEPKKNAFFIENDAYRFLVAKNQGYPWNDFQEMLYKYSWNHSVGEIERMFSHITSLPPHQLDATISLNNAKRIVTELSEPIVQLAQNIQKNLDKINQTQGKLNENTNIKKNLADVLETTLTDLVKRPNQTPQMVCKARGCTEVVNVDGEEKINYRTVCHKPCMCLSANELFGSIVNKLCDAMDTNPLVALLGVGDVRCRHCRCSWTDHMPVSYTYEKVTKKIVNSDVERKIRQASSDIEAKELLIRATQEKLEEFMYEKKKIEEIGSKFAYFLSANSTFTHNRYFESYVELLIEEENRKSRPNIAALSKLKLDHQESVERLKKAIASKSSAPVTAEDIPRLQEELLSLKHNGPQFRQILQANEELSVKFKSSEKKFDLQKSVSGLLGKIF